MAKPPNNAEEMRARMELREALEKAYPYESEETINALLAHLEKTLDKGDPRYQDPDDGSPS